MGRRHRTALGHRTGTAIGIPLIVLAILSLVVGFMEMPAAIGNVHLLSNFLKTALPSVEMTHAGSEAELALSTVSGVICLLGIAIAYFFFLRHRDRADAMAAKPVGALLYKLWFSGWGFDWVHDRFIVRPFLRLTYVNRADFFDFFYELVAWTTESFCKGLSVTQSGSLRRYAFAIGIGVVVTLGMLVLT
jgi:NADH-quinone oxidoreductase subunit L